MRRLSVLFKAVNAGKSGITLDLDRTAVKLLDRNGCKIKVFNAPDADRSHLISCRIIALCVGMNPARQTKAMLDDVLVEPAGACIMVCREQAQLIPYNELQQRAPF